MLYSTSEKSDNIIVFSIQQERDGVSIPSVIRRLAAVATSRPRTNAPNTRHAVEILITIQLRNGIPLRPLRAILKCK